jgi:diaminopimelate decarboxylase
MTHFSYQNNSLHAEHVDLTALAQQHATPLYVYSRNTMLDNLKAYQEGLAGLNTKICYAMKANSALAILDTLIKAGAGVDVVSGGEIEIALKAGAKPSSIVFSGVGKTAEEMKFALEQGIYQFNVESEPELDLLNQVAGSMKRKAAIALRVNPDVDPKTHAKISTGQKETKFGIGMDHAVEVYKRAAAMENIKVQGVSVHIGSQLTSLEPFREAYHLVRDFVIVLREAGIELDVIDLGGGLGIVYKHETPPTAQAYGALVKEIFAGFLDKTFLFEPGRSIIAKAGVLLTKVLYVKHGEDKTHVIVDAGMTELIRPAMYEAYHACDPVAQSAANAVTQPVDLVGPVCETGDLFAADRAMVLPQAGDLLVFRDAGAYGMVMSSTYNARPHVAEVMVDGKTSVLIRPRQTVASLTAGQFIPDWA